MENKEEKQSKLLKAIKQLINLSYGVVDTYNAFKDFLNDKEENKTLNVIDKVSLLNSDLILMNNKLIYDLNQLVNSLLKKI